MKSKVVMTSSAVFLWICGIFISFLPQELLSYLGQKVSVESVIILQLAGALYMGMGMLNWMSKGNLIGGIYSRPLVMANILHFSVGALALLKSIFKDDLSNMTISIVAIIYSLFALGFITLIFTTPNKVAQQKIEN